MCNPYGGGSQTCIRVLIVGGAAVARSGLQFFVLAFDDLQLVGEATSGEQAVQMCGDLHPDVVLMDLAMPGMDGVRAIRVIHQQWPAMRVIALTSFRDSVRIRNAFQAGATSCLFKGMPAHDLANAIRSVHSGFPPPEYKPGGGVIPPKQRSE
jgi:two-component system, NarL family, response regulator LiaR